MSNSLFTPNEASEVRRYEGSVFPPTPTRQMCLRYINEHLIKQGNGGRTRFNQALHLKQWLKFHKLDLLTSADMPDYTTDDPVALEDDELDLFWQACLGHKRLLYTVLL